MTLGSSHWLFQHKTFFPTSKELFKLQLFWGENMLTGSHEGIELWQQVETHLQTERCPCTLTCRSKWCLHTLTCRQKRCPHIHHHRQLLRPGQEADNSTRALFGQRTSFISRFISPFVMGNSFQAFTLIWDWILCWISWWIVNCFTKSYLGNLSRETGDYNENWILGE